MSTKGKTWKWKDDAKRKWKWREEVRKNQWCFKYDGDKRILKYFKWMWGRCTRKDLKCDFPRTQKGFEEFCKEMGPIPENMKRPSVGRKNHNKGYVYKNIVWEPYKYNVWKSNRVNFDELQQTLLQQPEQESENEIPF